MDNPWKDLPATSPRILPTDLPAIQAFNERYDGDFAIQTHLMPEPFIGSPDAAVYVLSLNPGYSPDDDLWHENQEYSSAISSSICHESMVIPFYFFDPLFALSPGSRWWLRRCRRLINDVGQENLSRQLFCVELFPYHSRKYRQIPRSILPSKFVPSSAYTAQLVRQAVKQNKQIVVMRAYRQWIKLVPELAEYEQIHTMKNPRNVSFSPGNLSGYPAIVTAMKATSHQ